MTPSNKVAARNRNILGGIVTGLGGRGIGLLAPFLVMPAMLKHLGEAHFGIWMTVVSITSMAMFLDFGIGNGLLTKLSKAYGNDDLPAMRRLIATGYAALTIIALAVAVLLVVAWGWLITSGRETLLHTKDAVAMQIGIVTGIAFLIGIPVSVIQRVMLSCQQNVQSNGWQIAGSFVAVAACYGVIKSELSSATAVAAYAFSPILVMLVATAFFFARNPTILPRKIDLSMSNARELIALGSYFFILSIITSIALNSDNIIIAFVLGAEAVTEYAIPAKLASILGLLVTTLFLPLWPANGEAIERKDYKWIEENSLRMSLLGGILVGIIGLLLVLFSEKIVEIWMGRLFLQGAEVVLGFALLYTLFAFVSPYNMILNSAGSVGVQILAWLLFFASNIGLKLYLLNEFNNFEIMPYANALCYAVFIAPIIYLRARKVYLLKNYHS